MKENAVRFFFIKFPHLISAFLVIQISNDILKLPSEVLELERPFKLFDMKKFQQNVNWELKRQYPERRKLETQV